MAVDTTTLNNLLASISAQNTNSQNGGAPDWLGYIDNNPDMAAAYAKGTGYAKGRTKAQFGQIVYENNVGSGSTAWNKGQTYDPVKGYQNAQSATPYTSSDGQSFATIGDETKHENDLTNQKSAAALTAAQTRATSQAQQAFTNQGLDPSQYSSNISDQINQIVAGIPAGDTDPAGYFPSNLGDTIIGNLQSGQRATYGRQVNSTFSPTYDSTQLPSNTLDSQIQDILGTQGKQASDALDRAQARGQINDVGYAGGQTTFGNERAQALSKLNSMASDVLTGYKTRLDNVETGARNAASSFNLGDTFNLNDYLGQANDLVGQAKTNAGGDLLNQLGGTKLFDINSILGDAGIAQGAVNLKNQDVMNAIAGSAATTNQKRGLGSQGAF